MAKKTEKTVLDLQKEALKTVISKINDEYYGDEVIRMLPEIMAQVNVATKYQNEQSYHDGFLEGYTAAVSELCEKNDEDVDCFECSDCEGCTGCEGCDGSNVNCDSCEGYEGPGVTNYFNPEDED